MIQKFVPLAQRLNPLLIKCTIVLTLVCVCFVLPLYAQETEYDSLTIDRIKSSNLEGQVGVAFNVVNHQDTLRRAHQAFGDANVGLGLSVYAAYSFAPHPLVLGADVGFNFYGLSNKTITPVGSSIRTAYEIQSFQIPVLAFARLQPSAKNWIFPFVEGVGGFTTFLSSLGAADNQGNNNNNTISETEASVTWNYGVGVGLGVKVADIISLPSTLERIFIETRMRYIRNTPTTLPNVAFNEQNNVVIKNISVPASSTVSFTIGVTFQF